MDAIGLFLLIAGYVIGLGAVTVIDIHGFLGRKSAYWTEATTRTHKVTKPLIWLGIVLVSIGGIIYFRNESFSGTPLYLAVSAFVLVCNGVFLSFSVSPYILARERAGTQAQLLPQSWQNKILVSLILSDIGWWGSLIMLVIYITHK